MPNRPQKTPEEPVCLTVRKKHLKNPYIAAV
jgi:hypothetical protein